LHAIISGGSSGIGLAVGALLVDEGWNLSILARDRERLAAARGALVSRPAAAGQSVFVRSVDVAEAEPVAEAVAEAIATLGPPDLLIASAGIVIPLPFAELAAQDFRRTMEVNYLGTVHLIQAALPALRCRRGRIVMIASGAAFLGLYGYTAYAPSKFALRGLAEALRSELRPEGVGVSIVYPPDTETPQLAEEIRRRPEITSRIAGAARARTAEEVAAAILAGVRRGRFTIAPGWEMSALAVLHSLLSPLFHRVWFDRVVARERRRAGPAAD
jgi:3-dehydrosphinganine reductase